MRIDVRKMLFVGLASERDSFFCAAQEVGLIHFIDVAGKRHIDLPRDLEHLMLALKVLRGLPPMEQEEIEDFHRTDPIVEALLACQHAIEQSEEQQRLLHQELARVEPFGSFSSSDIAYIERVGHCKAHFYWSKKGIFADEELPDKVIWVTADHGLDYFIAFSKESIADPRLTEMHLHDSSAELREKLARLKQEQHNLEVRLKGYAKYSTFLHQALVDKLNRYHLHKAQGTASLSMDGLLFAVEGWVPENHYARIQALAEELNLHSEEIAVNPGEVPVTYLENSGPARIGEDLVNIYDIPSNGDKDPSLWVFCFFSLFFAMIVGDGGYGLIFVATALYLRWKFGKFSIAGTRVWKLTMTLAVSCVLWGTMMHSFFGISLAPDNPLVEYSLLNRLVGKKLSYHVAHNDETFLEWQKEHPQIGPEMGVQEMLLSASRVGANNAVSYEMYNKFADDVMMEVAIFMGVVHILLSLLRYCKRQIGHIGWMAFVIGGYLYLPGYLQAVSFWQYLAGIDQSVASSEGLRLMIGGVGLAVVIAIIHNGIKGIFELMNAVQVFSDVLSYLRLYALGTAGAIMSATVNDMAAMCGFVGGLLVLALGHLFNVTLNVMGGVIHGLRLNFLEWYHYSFEGGGKPFRPLERISIE